MNSQFRNVVIEDAKLIFDWMNDTESRKASFNTAPLVYEDHSKWLTRKIDDPLYHLQIGEVNGVPVGYFRMQIINNEYGSRGMASNLIAPDQRGKGYGKALFHAFVSQWPLIPIVMEVKEDNKPSIHIVSSMQGVQEMEPDLQKDGSLVLQFVRWPLGGI